MEERRAHPELVGEMLYEQLTGLAVLGEHQRRRTEIEVVGHDIGAQVELAGSAGQLVELTGDQARVIAHLFEAGQRGQDPALALGAVAEAVIDGAVEQLIVEPFLFGGEIAEQIGVDLGR